MWILRVYQNQIDQSTTYHLFGKSVKIHVYRTENASDFVRQKRKMHFSERKICRSSIQWFDRVQ